MNLSSYSIKQKNHLQERSQTWMQEIAAYFPNDFEDKIKQFGALQRKRGVKSGLDFMKRFLLYAVAQEQKADVILRITPSHFLIYNREGQKIDLFPLLSQAKKNGYKTIEIQGYIHYKKTELFYSFDHRADTRRKSRTSQKKKTKKSTKKSV